MLCVCIFYILVRFFFFFFKQKTAYEMRISDWSSDVCSSDLRLLDRHAVAVPGGQHLGERLRAAEQARAHATRLVAAAFHVGPGDDLERPARPDAGALHRLQHLKTRQPAVGTAKLAANSDERRVGSAVVTEWRSARAPYNH